MILNSTISLSEMNSTLNVTSSPPPVLSCSCSFLFLSNCYCFSIKSIFATVFFVAKKTILKEREKREHLFFPIFFSSRFKIFLFFISFLRVFTSAGHALKFFFCHFCLFVSFSDQFLDCRQKLNYSRSHLMWSLWARSKVIILTVYYH